MSVDTSTGEISETSPTPYQLLPRLTDEEYAALKADIAENGIRVPIDVDKQTVQRAIESSTGSNEPVDLPARVVGQDGKSQPATKLSPADLDSRRSAEKELRDQGYTFAQIAELFGLAESTVKNDLKSFEPIDAEPDVTGRTTADKAA